MSHTFASIIFSTRRYKKGLSALFMMLHRSWIRHECTLPDCVIKRRRTELIWFKLWQCQHVYIHTGYSNTLGIQVITLMYINYAISLTTGCGKYVLRKTTYVCVGVCLVLFMSICFKLFIYFIYYYCCLFCIVLLLGIVHNAQSNNYRVWGQHRFQRIISW